MSPFFCLSYVIVLQQLQQQQTAAFCSSSSSLFAPISRVRPASPSPPTSSSPRPAAPRGETGGRRRAAVSAAAAVVDAEDGRGGRRLLLWKALPQRRNGAAEGKPAFVRPPPYPSYPLKLGVPYRRRRERLAMPFSFSPSVRLRYLPQQNEQQTPPLPHHRLKKLLGVVEGVAAGGGGGVLFSLSSSVVHTAPFSLTVTIHLCPFSTTRIEEKGPPSLALCSPNAAVLQYTERDHLTREGNQASKVEREGRGGRRWRAVVVSFPFCRLCVGVWALSYTPLFFSF